MKSRMKLKWDKRPNSPKKKKFVLFIFRRLGTRSETRAHTLHPKNKRTKERNLTISFTTFSLFAILFNISLFLLMSLLMFSYYLSKSLYVNVFVYRSLNISMLSSELLFPGSHIHRLFNRSETLLFGFGDVLVWTSYHFGIISEVENTQRVKENTEIVYFVGCIRFVVCDEKLGKKRFRQIQSHRSDQCQSHKSFWLCVSSFSRFIRWNIHLKNA